MKNQQLESLQSSKQTSKSNLDQTVRLLTQKVYEETLTFITASSSIAKGEAELLLALRFQEADEAREQKIAKLEKGLKADKAVCAACITNCQKLQEDLQSLGYQFRLVDSKDQKEKFNFLLHVGRVEHRTPLSSSLAFCDFCDQPATVSTRFHQLCQHHSRSKA